MMEKINCYDWVFGYHYNEQFTFDKEKMRLHITDEQYYINKEKKTVTIVAYVKVSVPRAITRLLGSYLPEVFTHHVKMSHTAKCIEGDVFDEEKGKKIALATLETKAYESSVKSLLKWLSRYNEWVKHLMEVSQEYAIKAVKSASHNREYIDKIS